MPQIFRQHRKKEAGRKGSFEILAITACNPGYIADKMY
jgi:hypothetical protein